MTDSRNSRMVLISLMVAVLVGGLLAAVEIFGLPGRANADAQLYLEAVNDVGPNPFVPAAAKKSSVASPGGTSAAPGGAPSVNESTVCDAAALVRTLQGDARLASSWTEALNSDPTLTWSGGNKVRPDQVEAFISELSPQVLTKDVRVTNFQYTSGAPTSVQSVLQTGSPVMVDKVGVVRVRCKCGNPLTPMKRLTAKPVYQGKPWVGFVDIDIIVINKCDDNEYYRDGRCRPIDCKDGYYFNGNDCRPIKCDNDEKFKDGYCRPIKCDNDEKFFDGRGCEPPACDNNKVFDGKKCSDPDCPSGKTAVGKDCQGGDEQCKNGKNTSDGKDCQPPKCDPNDKNNACDEPDVCKTDPQPGTDCLSNASKKQGTTPPIDCTATAADCTTTTPTGPDCKIDPAAPACTDTALPGPDCTATPTPASCTGPPATNKGPGTTPDPCAATPQPAGCPPPVDPCVADPTLATCPKVPNSQQQPGSQSGSTTTGGDSGNNSGNGTSNSTDKNNGDSSNNGNGGG